MFEIKEKNLLQSQAFVVDRSAALALYRTMQLIRQTEEMLARCHQQGLIHGACHTYVGQEAIAVGVCAYLTKDDVVFSTHRGHGHALAKGMPVRELVAELFGRVTGCSQGRGGSMHLFSPEIGLMGTSGIVGPSILQACGGAYSSKLLGKGGVSVAFFGDGAVNNGAFHEGLNMAGIWKLPAVFVCENNQYATEVPFSYASGSADVGSRAEVFGIAGSTVDGNDVLAVREAAGLAVERARAGDGATLIECRTYRTRPHAEGMGDFTYRTREEVAEWKQRCPIALFRQRLVEEWGCSADELRQIDKEVTVDVAEAKTFAQASAWPAPPSAATHVYAEPRRVDRQPPPPDGERRISYSQATLEALAGEMAHNERIVVLGEGIGARGGNFQTTSGLFAKYGPVRLCDTPICERGFVGLACGAAMTGTRPVVDFMFADFALDATGEIINQIAKMQYMSSGRLRIPVLLRACVGVGHSAATHHSGSYYGLFAQAPGLRVVLPSTPYDAKGLLTHALRSDDPVLFLEHRELLSLQGGVPVEDYEIEFGRAAVVRSGQSVTVVALARMVWQTLSLCDELAAGGISVELIDPRTAAPLDEATILQSVAKTGRLLIVEETPSDFGLGAEIAARMADAGFDHLDAPIKRLGGLFVPTPYSPPLEAAVIPQPDTIRAAILALMDE